MQSTVKMNPTVGAATESHDHAPDPRIAGVRHMSLQPSDAYRRDSSVNRDSSIGPDSIRGNKRRGPGTASIAKSSFEEFPRAPFEATGHSSHKKTLVLCFDGTGDEFTDTQADSNILKIYRMLDRSATHYLSYYQPGIGTYHSAQSLNPGSMLSKIYGKWQAIKDMSVGTSFGDHVMGGYKFLMRYYNPGDDIYFFGFSRGSYTARFLADMIHNIGLLSAGNEEMTWFAWNTFRKWQARLEATSKQRAEKDRMRQEMQAFRETFSRPVKQIRFLGIFDTVNSVSQFESAWMSRSKGGFPYAAHTTAQVIRHAVAIDERRVKFRQDLVSEKNPGLREKRWHRTFESWHKTREKFRAILGLPSKPATSLVKADGTPAPMVSSSTIDTHPPVEPAAAANREKKTQLKFPHEGGKRKLAGPANELDPELDSDEEAELHYDDASNQDVQEVWFMGNHSDIGGGWPLTAGEERLASHIPLVWMVREARRAGLQMDMKWIHELECWDRKLPANPHPLVGVSEHLPVAADHGPHNHVERLWDDKSRKDFHGMLHRIAKTCRLHDSLTFDGGGSAGMVLQWQIFERIPFRRLDLKADGSWRPIRWPLPLGETRDIPANAQIHHSVIKRMRADPKYRPGNLIIGGGGRGCRTAPERYGVGDWTVYREPGDVIGETWRRADLDEATGLINREYAVEQALGETNEKEINGHGEGVANGTGNGHVDGHANEMAVPTIANGSGSGSGSGDAEKYG